MTGISYMKGGGATTGMPIHRLNKLQTLIWLKILGLEPKRMMASNLAKKYPTGCYVCSDTGLHFGNVNPNGAFIDLPPPHQRYRPWEYANKPAAMECPCADFMDPEAGVDANGVGIPWKARDSEEHHPLCQHDKTAIAVYTDRDQIGVHNAQLIVNRPDTWLKARSHYRGK